MFKVPKNVLVSLNSKNINENKSVAFFLPGLEGNCDCLKELSQKLSSNYHVYGLEYSDKVPNDSIESAAKFFLEHVERKLIELGKNNCFLAGYSFGGLIAIEMCALLERNKHKFSFAITNLILLESSHKFFRVGVHSNAKNFGTRLPNKDIFLRNTAYIGSLSIYLSAMLGQPPETKFALYNHLKETCTNLDDALNKAFDFLISQSYYTFESETELNETKFYLKILLLKSNAGVLYDFNLTRKLKIPCCLIKTKQFMYRRNLNELYVKKDFESDDDDDEKLEFDCNNYCLHEIVENLTVYSSEIGNHWTFLIENSEAIANYIIKFMDSYKSKL